MSCLYLVPTPVGNLQDMTFRAVEVLKSVDLILAEDTRTSSKLMQHFGIETPLKSHHMHNEHKSLQHWLDLLKSGQSLAIITDAGTPGISDPGFLLTRACTEAGIEVCCLPGATAIIPAVAASGIPCDRFVFEGFLPPKKGRQTRLELLAEESRTVILYESPHKLLKSLDQLGEFFGADRNMAACREISKLHEEYVRGSIAEVKAHFEQHAPRGEFVLVIAGKGKK